MSIFSKIFDATAGNLVGAIAGAADRFITTGDEKNAFKLEAAALVAARDSELEQTMRAELQAKERVLVAELQQGDNYTKRARPTVVYGGLVILTVNSVILPWIAHFTGQVVPEIQIPAIFWTGWAGIVATWSIGRTMEKRGAGNQVTSLITGS